MIKLLNSGTYKLIETKHHTKVLYLQASVYGWVQLPNNSEILVASHKIHKTDYVLSLGKFRLYDVDDEPYLSDQVHLELEVGQKHWQGYLLLTGLPNNVKKRGRIIPTEEVITGNPAFVKPKKKAYSQTGQKLMKSM